MRLLACMLCLAATGPAPAAADRRPRVTTRRVAPGVTHVRIVRRHPPNRINVLRVAVRARPAVDVVLARPDSFGFGKTSRVAERYGAVAAVNGTFSLDNGRPYSVFARNGNLEASPLMWSRAFSLSADETRLSIGHPRLEVTLEDPDSDATWTLDSVNERPWPGEMALYTPAGGRFYRPPWNACSARLRGDGGLEWGEEASGVLRTYVVEHEDGSLRDVGSRGAPGKRSGLGHRVSRTRAVGGRGLDGRVAPSPGRDGWQPLAAGGAPSSGAG
jgi:hypothetical protein